MSKLGLVFDDKIRAQDWIGKWTVEQLSVTTGACGAARPRAAVGSAGAGQAAILLIHTIRDSIKSGSKLKLSENIRPQTDRR